MCTPQHYFLSAVTEGQCSALPACLGWALVKCTGMRGCFKGPLGVRNPLGTVKGIAG